MPKYRKNVELLKLLRDNLNFLHTGLCELALALRFREKITSKEYCRLKDYISREGKKLKVFYHLDEKRYSYRLDYFFFPKGDIKSRKRWLTKLIKNEESKKRQKKI